MTVREFRLPDLGEGLEDAEIVAWRVAEGDSVELNQTLVEVNTAKALVEIPAPWEGVVQKLHAAEGDVLAVGAPLVSIAVEETVAEDASAEPAASAASAAAETARADNGQRAGRPKRRPVLVGYGVAEEEEEPAKRSARREGRRGQGSGPVPASPPVRRLAKDLAVDLTLVTGTGPRGRVTREDVLRFAEEGTERRGGVDEAGESRRDVTVPSGPRDERLAVRGVRRLVAEKMARSAREIPHVTTFLTVDATWLEAFRRDLERREARRLTALPLVVRAFVEIVKEHRALNASFDAATSEIVLRGDVHVGVATDTERGLLVPVIRHADRLGIVELADEISRLVESARSGRSRPDELAGSTVTVSNVGSFGAEYGTPIINYPEAAILAVGVIAPRALVVDGRVEARPAVTLSLSFDHRVMDGAEAGRAMRDLARLLESPFELGALPR